MSETETTPPVSLDVCAMASAGSTLTVREVALLAYLGVRPGLSVKEYAAALNVQKPVITRAVDRLERDGLVHRHNATSDGRKVAIHATAAGCLMLAQFGSAA